jgi:hypothetical protein
MNDSKKLLRIRRMEAAQVMREKRERRKDVREVIDRWHEAKCEAGYKVLRIGGNG